MVQPVVAHSRSRDATRGDDTDDTCFIVAPEFKLSIPGRIECECEASASGRIECEASEVEKKAALACEGASATTMGTEACCRAVARGVKAAICVTFSFLIIIAPEAAEVEKKAASAVEFVSATAAAVTDTEACCHAVARGMKAAIFVTFSVSSIASSGNGHDLSIVV